MKITLKIVLTYFLFFISFTGHAQNSNEIKIAKAAIKSIMSVNSKYIKSYNENGKKLLILQSSKTKSTYYAIYFSKNQIIWRIEKDNSKNTPGRWRNNNLDEKITYKIVNDKVIIDVIYSDRSIDRKSFDLKDL